MTIDKRSKSYDMFILKDVEYKSQICPLVFQNTNIRTLALVNLVDSFYKKSVLTFEDINNKHNIEFKNSYIRVSQYS